MYTLGQAMQDLFLIHFVVLQLRSFAKLFSNEIYISRS